MSSWEQIVFMRVSEALEKCWRTEDLQGREMRGESRWLPTHRPSSARKPSGQLETHLVIRQNKAVEKKRERPLRFSFQGKSYNNQVSTCVLIFFIQINLVYLRLWRVLRRQLFIGRPGPPKFILRFFSNEIKHSLNVPLCPIHLFVCDFLSRIHATKY